MLTVYVKPVCSEPARYSSVLLHESFDAVSEYAQDPVAKLPPVYLIDQMEVIDVQHDGIHRHIRLFRMHTIGILEKVIPVIQPCQLIGLSRTDQLLSLFLSPHAS